MSETKFTPGPWHVLREGLTDLSVEPGIMYNSLLDIPREEREEQLANAALIAAAPEMYADIERIRKWFIGAVGYMKCLGPDEEMFARKMTQEINWLGDTLAKARGED